MNVQRSQANIWTQCLFNVSWDVGCLHLSRFYVNRISSRLVALNASLSHPVFHLPASQAAVLIISSLVVVIVILCPRRRSVPLVWGNCSLGRLERMDEHLAESALAVSIKIDLPMQVGCTHFFMLSTPRTSSTNSGILTTEKSSPYRSSICSKYFRCIFLLELHCSHGLSFLGNNS